MEKRAIVTGATGQIGHALTKLLIAEGYEVFAVVHPGSRRADVPRDCGAKVISLETENISKIEALLPSIDFFFHLAWAGAGGAARQDTALQEKNVRDSVACMKTASRLCCKKFVFAGSQAEYGRVDGLISEETPLQPELEYGRCKSSVLTAAREMGISYAHARIFSVYGYEDAAWTVTSDCVSSFLENSDIELSECTQKWNFLYFKDAASALLTLAILPQKNSAEVFNLAGDDTRELKSFIEEIRRLTGTSGKPLYGARASAVTPISLDPDTSKLLATGWKPQYTFGDGISEMIKKYRSELK